MNVFEILGFRHLIWFRLADILSVCMSMILIKANTIHVMSCIEEDAFYVVVFKIKFMSISINLKKIFYVNMFSTINCYMHLDLLLKVLLCPLFHFKLNLTHLFLNLTCFRFTIVL